VSKILMIDNYDSFTYNLFQYFSELGSSVEVWRNDSFELDDIKGFDPDLIVISPGPSRPEKAGLSMEVVQTFADTYPILGVCLGHQVIGAVFGARVIRAERIMHGKTSQVFHNEKNLFRGVSNPVTATRYHSLIIENENLPDKISVCAKTDQDEIMGIHVKDTLVFGVQFHPESILSVDGKLLLRNAIELSST
jgi:anthranilate synthase/aminodeoxychorismate synthase-like glutamine amidotransferase